MPHALVKTIRQLIYWEYAKFICGSAVHDRKNRAFGMHCYKRLLKGEIHPSGILRENKLMYESEKECVYCGAKEDLSWDHIIPRSKYLIDDMDNYILACMHCNSSKTAKI